MALLLAFAKCTDCGVKVSVHSGDIDGTYAALAHAVQAHIDDDHTDGGPVAFQITGVAVQRAS